jgi:maltooligosyltrehalose synthase
LADHIVAFARDEIVTIAPRLLRRLLESDRSDLRVDCDDVAIRLELDAAECYRDRFTGAVLVTDRDDAGPFLTAKAALTPFPIAVLEPI